MKVVFRFLSISLSLGMTFLIFGGPGSCGMHLADALLDSDGYSYSEDTSDQGDTVSTDDKLLVDGQGKNINVSYNDLVFPALLNMDSGLYYFAPDPDGKITGDKIVCASSIDENEVEGDCFRQGHVCHFDYWRETNTTVDGKDVYRLGSTSCRRGAEVGPFLVPLESPMCGQDPFPACPSDDLFPCGPTEEKPAPTSTPGTTTPTNTNETPTTTTPTTTPETPTTTTPAPTDTTSTGTPTPQ
jgi:hypothetical protein